MNPTRLAPTLAVALVLSAGLLAWFFYPTPTAAPVATPIAVGGAQTGEAGPAAMLSADPGREASAATPGAGDAREAITAAATSGTRVQLSGRFVAADGRAAPGVEFALVPRDDTAAIELLEDLGLRDEGALRITAGPDGRFRTLVPAGKTHFLSVRDERHYLREGESGAGVLRVAGLAADRDLGDLVVGRTARLAGRVEDQQTGRPAAGVRVSTGGPIFSGRGGMPQTDDQGRFAFAALRPGKYVLTTQSPDYLPAQVELELGEGEAKDDLVVRLAAGGTIHGVVTDDTGKPVAGIKVGAERSRALRGGVQMQTTNAAEATTTDAAGHFVLRGLEAGAVTVSAWGKGYARASQEGVAAGVSDLVLRVPRLARIEGVVVDGAGAPVVGSEVTTRPDGGGFVAMTFARDPAKTGANGAFVVEDVTPGRCVLEATGDHRPAMARGIEVGPGETRTGVRLVVERGATLVVTVLDHEGKPVEGASVEVTSVAADATPMHGMSERRVMRRVRAGGPDGVVVDDGTVLGQARTDAEGVARVAGLSPGRVRAKARHTILSAAQTDPLDVPDAGEVEAKLTLAPGGLVTVAAFAADRTPLPNAPFKLVGPLEAKDAAATEAGKCDGKGLASVGPLAPGTYRAVLARPPQAMDLGQGGTLVTLDGDQRELEQSATRLTVVAGQTTQVELVRPVLATFRGVVRDAKGPVAGARVRLAEAGAPDLGMLSSGPSTSTDADGRFELTDLSAGNYTVRFGHADAIMQSETDLAIAAGEALVERDLLLSTGAIRVVVRDEEGEPVARAQVRLERAGTTGGAAPRPRRAVMIMSMSTDSGEGPSTTSISSGTPSVTTDIEGVAELPRVPSGDYSLRITHPRHATTRRSEVKVLEGATADLGTVTMAPGGSVGGRVLNSAGQQVQMAEVEIAPVQGGEPSVEMAVGGVVRASGLAAGRYRARARVMGMGGDGRAPEWGPPVEFELEKGGRTMVDLRVL